MTGRRVRHLARRFFGALRPGGPSPDDAAWVATVLEPAEHDLWQRMPAHDRRHAVAVARRVEAALAGTSDDGDERWLAAALLHDVGKLDSGLGVLARAGATVAGAVAGHDMADAWSEKRGITRRVGLYLRHAELGETRLGVIGARPEAAAWAGAHHDEERWRTLDFPSHVVTALDAADDD
jgi:hypothetical protein